MIDKIKSLFNIKSKPIDAFMSGSGSDKRFAKDKDQINAYSGSLPWVSIGVDIIIRDIFRKEWNFVNENGDFIDNKRVNKNIYGPINAGFEGRSFDDCIRFVITHMILSGNGYIWKSKSSAYGQSNNVADTLIPISSSNVTIKMKLDQYRIDYYEVNLGGVVYRVPRQDMIHFRSSSTKNMFEGIGIVEKLGILAVNDIGVSEYVNEFIDTAKKMPQLIFSDSEQRSEEDMRRFKSIIQERYGLNSLYINGEGAKVEQSSLLDAGNSFRDNREYNRQAILSMMGIPPVVAGIVQSANRANSHSQRLNYYQNTINPLLVYIEDAINTQFINTIDENIFLEFDKYDTGDIDSISKMINAGIITPNKAAELMGMPVDYEDESRNQYYLPSNLYPTDFIDDVFIAENNPDNSAKSIKKNEISKKEDEVLGHAPKPKKHQLKYIEAANISKLKVENKYTRNVSQFFKDQSERVNQIISDKEKKSNSKSIKIGIGDINVDELIDHTDDEILASVLLSLHTSAAQRSIRDINEITNSSVNLDTSNPAVSAALRNLGARITGEYDHFGNRISISETTRRDLQTLVEQSVNEGWTTNELQDAISDKFDQYQGSRARMIARTEASKAYDIGSRVAYQEIGVKTVDIVGCTTEETNSDCGRMNVSIDEIDSLSFHPNHKGTPAPSEEI